MELTREQKQEIIDNHVGIVPCEPFEVEVRDDSRYGWEKGLLVCVLGDVDVYPYCYRVYKNNCGNHSEMNESGYEQCRLPPEKKTRPTTVKEIVKLAREGAAFIINRATYFNPTITWDLDSGVHIGGVHISLFDGYRLPYDPDDKIRPFVVEETE